MARGPREFRAAERIGQTRAARRTVPVAIGSRLAIGQGYSAEWRGKQIGIDRDRDSLRVRIDSAEGD